MLAINFEMSNETRLKKQKTKGGFIEFITSDGIKAVSPAFGCKHRPQVLCFISKLKQKLASGCA